MNNFHLSAAALPTRSAHPVGAVEAATRLLAIPDPSGCFDADIPPHDIESAEYLSDPQRPTNVFMEPVEDSTWSVPRPTVRIMRPFGSSNTSLWYEI